MKSFAIFAIPKSFKNPHTALIQKNAFNSWKQLTDEIYILGDVAGAKEQAEKVGASFIPKVATNQWETPLLDSAFNLVREKSQSDLLVFVNSDIVFLKDFKRAISFLPADEFLVAGQRWDLDVNYLINFKDRRWEEKFQDAIQKNGLRHQPAGSDYFIFRPNSFTNLPPFAVGRITWDNWMIYEARRRQIPVIDASLLVTAIHQNHDYSHYRGPGRNVWSGPEAQHHLNIIGSKARIFDITDNTWSLTTQGLKRQQFALVKLLRYIRQTPEVLPGSHIFWNFLSRVINQVYNPISQMTANLQTIQENALGYSLSK